MRPRLRARERRAAAARGQCLVDDAVALGSFRSVASWSSSASVSRSNRRRISAKPDRRFFVDAERAAEVEVALGADAALVRRRSPARSRPLRSVTPAQATSASSSMSPEHSRRRRRRWRDAARPGRSRGRCRRCTRLLRRACRSAFSVTSAASGSRCSAPSAAPATPSVCLGPCPQVKRPRLFDEVVAERTVRRFVLEREAFALVDAAGGGRLSFVQRRASRSSCAGRGG